MMLYKDCEDRNPLIRALAIRTMSYIPLPTILSALRDPLRHSLRDSDPYVRKTAAICVAKAWMHDSKLVDKEGFIGMLRDLLADPNPTVVANAVAALTEISDRSDDITLKLNVTVASKLLAALGECSEYVCLLRFG
jgi:AP-2 complex subunit beta-1